MIVLYIIALISLTVYSFGFVDANFPIKILPKVFELVHVYRSFSTGFYIFLLTFLFFFYLWSIRKPQIIWKLIFLTVGVLFFSFPAFSYDIFNYIATAKVAFLYKENPYVTMPIEFLNEPMLSFLHAANKVALYGPTWIALTYLPHAISDGNILVSLWAFKTLVAVFYLGVCWLLWKMGGNKALVFFALNPLVITETLVSGHNDVVMMFFALLAFYLYTKKQRGLGFLSLILSIFVKGATIVLLPLYLLKIPANRPLPSYTLLLMFFLTPFREELYPWYFIWPLTFIALLPQIHILRYIAYGFSFGLPFRFAPFIFYGEWGGLVPVMKKFISFVPPFISLMYGFKKKS